MNTFDTDVLIAGGGPVGMTLALELARHGVRSIVAERNTSTTDHPKMDLTNGRSMELFRRLGIVDKLRAVGVAQSEPLDIVWATGPLGHVLHRFAYPAPQAAAEITRLNNDGSGTREPSMRVSQIVLEPVLKQEIDASPAVDVRFGWKYTTLEQDGESVTATLVNSETGEEVLVRSRYLVGCDGGGSKVRRDLGIDLEGQHAIAQAFMVHFQSEDVDTLGRFGLAYHLQTLKGTMIAQNGRDIFTLHVVGCSPDSDPAELLRDFVGRDFDFDILVANPWTPHVVVATAYRSGRAFLCGDAAHQFVPTGGYGMNTGIGDAIDLGWKLAATITGWGGAALLDSYDTERRITAIRNRDMAFGHLATRLAINEQLALHAADASIDEPDAADRRIALGHAIRDLGNAENESWGIEHGFRYENSAVNVDDGIATDFDPMRCQGHILSGGRLPHVVLNDGRALFDLLGPGFTLVAIGTFDLTGFAEAAADIPATVVSLERESVLERWPSRLILVRPDQHVAWHGTQVPEDWRSIINIATGRSAA
ncbi:putative phenol monooxygenase [Caenibius tardaugens NBRC 16725]|uniref:Putative phenol monooxygenase n=1 Tax=Caenibius tardaugens NBRC 16725 TaxID=1219035 RepID=U2YNI9_9SPHN|nr:FAD-dependent monooxygenase [Caenibius tardaugens]AZI35504.1 FAD-monooxygenase [Caenibius tardaugens NBRC 16725]GAD50395.1 putative phenol monooxygenase [Caenibius tardaugens NBRC 16725]